MNSFFYENSNLTDINVIDPIELDCAIFSELRLVGYRLVSPSTVIILGMGKIPIKGRR